MCVLVNCLRLCSIWLQSQARLSHANLRTLTIDYKNPIVLSFYPLSSSSFFNLIFDYTTLFLSQMIFFFSEEITKSFILCYYKKISSIGNIYVGSTWVHNCFFLGLVFYIEVFVQRVPGMVFEEVPLKKQCQTLLKAIFIIRNRF